VIEQHYYTRRERGYGTVARSAGIFDNNVKCDILPYCVYSAGEGGKCLTAVHYPDGRMLLGQAVHVPRAFFQHNLIVPVKMVNAVLVAGFAGVQFETGYDAAQSGMLPALEKLPINKQADGIETNAHEDGIKIKKNDDEVKTNTNDNGVLTNRLYDFTEYDFTPLIRYLTLSAAGNKKTYIRTSTTKGPADTHVFALALLAELYPRLPTELRHVLGFCTNAREPLERNGIHLIFTDNPRLKGDFLIDFTEKTGIINNAGDEIDYFHVRFASMPTQRFCERIFGEIDFWLAREPRIAQAETFRQAITARMAQVLESGGILPEAFIRRGKSGKYNEIIGHTPSDFIMADIQRQVSILRPNDEDLRYIIGSYRLTPEKSEKILHTLQSEGYIHGTPP